MNQAIIEGKVTRKFDIRKVGQNKIPTIGFIVETPKPKMAYITCQAWEQMATDIHEDLPEGAVVQITGYIKTGSYKKDGKTVYTTDLLVEEITLLEEPKPKTGGFNRK
jgi:single-strand DNA-binding protein